MPNLKISQFTNLAGLQAPTDVIPVVVGSAAPNYKTTINDLFQDLGQNVTSRGIALTGVATGSAPSVSAASKGKLYYNTTLNELMLSKNAGAYSPISSGSSLYVPTSTFAGLPAAPSLVQQYKITNGNRGLWYYDTAGAQWVSNNGNIYDAKAAGAKGDNATDDRSALNTLANTTIPAAGGRIHFPAGTYLINSALSFPANVVLEFAPGAMLKPANGITVTILGQIVSTPYQIFTNANSGQGTISFSTNVAQKDYWWEWWGAKGDNSTASGPSINACNVAAAAVRGSTICCASNGYYRCAEGIVLDHAFQTSIVGNVGSIGYADPNTMPTILYLGAAGGTALTMSNVYACTVRGIQIECNNLADKGIYLTYVASGSPALTSRCAIQCCTIRSGGTRAGWIGIDINDLVGANNEHHLVEENLIQGGVTFSSTDQIGIRQGHAQVKSCVYRRNNISQVGTVIQFYGNFQSYNNTYSNVGTAYDAAYALESTRIEGDDVEVLNKIFAGNQQLGTIEFSNCRYNEVQVAGTSLATAPIKTVSGNLSFFNCYFQNSLNASFGAYFLAGPNDGSYPPVTFTDCYWSATTLNTMAAGFQSCNTIINDGGNTYQYGGTPFGFTNFLQAPAGTRYAQRITVGMAGTSLTAPGFSDALYLGDDSVGIGGLFMPNGLKLTLVGTTGATTRRFSIIARDSAGRRSLSYSDSSDLFVSTTSANATLSGVNYIRLTWYAQHPAPADYQVYEVNPADSSQWRFVATVAPSGTATESYNVQANPAGSFVATRPNYNEAGFINFRSSVIYPVENTFTDSDTTPSVAIGNDFRTANTGATSITTFDDPTDGKIIRVYVADSNTTFVNGATLVTGTGGNVPATNGNVYSFVYRNAAWRLLQVPTITSLSTLSITSALNINNGAKQVFKGNTTAKDLRIINGSVLDNLPSADFYPDSSANAAVGLRLIPIGSGFSATLKAQLVVSNTDQIADSTNYEALVLRAAGTDGFTIDSLRGGTGTQRPISFRINSSDVLVITTGSLVGLGGSTSSFPAFKRNSTVVELRLADDSAFAPLSSAAHTITSTSANSLAVGANGTTNPVLQVDASTASVATGIKITGAAALAGVTIAAISSGANEDIFLTPKGTGAVQTILTGNQYKHVWGNTVVTSALWVGTDSSIGTTSNHAFNLFTNGTDRINVSTAGNLGVGVTSYGTSAAKVLGIGNGTAPSSSPADMFQLYSADAAAGDAQAFARNEAGEIARLTGTVKYVTSNFSRTTDTTLANVTGLGFNVEAGKTYAFRAILFIDADATGGHKYAIAGTATATSVIYQVNSINNSTNAFVINSRQTALAGAAGQAGATTAYTEIVGEIVVNAAGTLTVQFAQNAASGTSTVLAGSHFLLKQQ